MDAFFDKNAVGFMKNFRICEFLDGPSVVGTLEWCYYPFVSGIPSLIVSWLGKTWVCWKCLL